MASPNTATVTVRISFAVTLWEAIKWRIAGPEMREEMVRLLRERPPVEGDEWKADGEVA
jgi:hypothetical protein